MSALPEDDRTFWVFIKRCGHVIGVATNNDWSAYEALWELYEDDDLVEAAIAAGIKPTLVDSSSYADEYIDKVREGCTCPS